MNRTRGLPLLLVLLIAACATLAPGSRGGERGRLWREAHLALRAQNFRAADSAFFRLMTEHPRTEEGREAIFFLGEIRMDPRNPGWNSATAADYLRRYLALASGEGKPEIHRAPEATTFLTLANQLNLPPDQRIAALRPGLVERTTPGPVRIVPSEDAQRLSAENERLRRELEERDAEIRRQREELNRIRNTLAPGRRPRE